MDSREASLHLATALAASARASRLLMGGGESREAVTSLGHDIKIKGDALAEKVLLEYLMERSPFPVLSEERGEVDREGGETCKWIVDPIDGSLNFNRGIPLCCISISLWRGNEPILGVVEDFNRGEIFSGIVGQGARLNGRDIRVSGVDKRSAAILCTGFPVYTDFSQEPLLRFLSQVQEYKKVRLLGSAALSLAYVAAGRADAYMENNIMLWDVAAGAALVLAAGGKAEWEARDKGLWFKAGNGLI